MQYNIDFLVQISIKFIYDLRWGAEGMLLAFETKYKVMALTTRPFVQTLI